MAKHKAESSPRHKLSQSLPSYALAEARGITRDMLHSSSRRKHGPSVVGSLLVLSLLAPASSETLEYRSANPETPTIEQFGQEVAQLPADLEERVKLGTVTQTNDREIPPQDQYPNGGIAREFTGTDRNGQTFVVEQVAADGANDLEIRTVSGDMQVGYVSDGTGVTVNYISLGNEENPYCAWYRAGSDPSTDITSVLRQAQDIYDLTMSEKLIYS